MQPPRLFLRLSVLLCGRMRVCLRRVRMRRVTCSLGRVLSPTRVVRRVLVRVMLLCGVLSRDVLPRDTVSQGELLGGCRVAHVRALRLCVLHLRMCHMGGGGSVRHGRRSWNRSGRRRRRRGAPHRGARFPDRRLGRPPSGLARDVDGAALRCNWSGGRQDARVACVQQDCRQCERRQERTTERDRDSSRPRTRGERAVEQGSPSWNRPRATRVALEQAMRGLEAPRRPQRRGGRLSSAVRRGLTSPKIAGSSVRYYPVSRRATTRTREFRRSEVVGRGEVVSAALAPLTPAPGRRRRTNLRRRTGSWHRRRGTTIPQTGSSTTLYVNSPSQCG